MAPCCCGRVSHQLATPSRAFAVGHICNQTGASLEGEVVPKPIKGDDEAIAQTNQKINVSDAPEQPAHKALELKRPEFYNRGTPADCCQIAKMDIAKWLAGLTACDATGKQFADVFPHLLRGGRDNGHWVTFPILSRTGVAEPAKFGVARHSYIGLNFNFGGSIWLFG